MIKHAFVALLLASSTAAVGQSTTQQTPDPLTPTAPTTNPSSATPAVPAEPATPADPATGVPAMPATPATPAVTEAPATQAVPPTAEPTAPTDAGGIVSADWSKYDKNSNKQLSRTEFSKWVTDLQAANGEKAPTRTYLNGAFRTADANKSGGVSEKELVAFLGS